MCKIAMVAGVKYPENLDTFTNAILPYMTQQDRDAVGYAAFSDFLHGERWLNPDIAFKDRPLKGGRTIRNTRLKEALQYNNFGRYIQINPKTSMILHTRFATCERGINNAHPFVSEDGKTALIHNGVVKPSGLTLRTSSCDSEGILNEYTKNDVMNNSGAIQQVFNKLNGSFACAVLTEDNNGKRFLDIFRNNSYASIITAYVDELGTNVFCTEPSIIENTVNDLGWGMETMYSLEDNTFMRLNARTGEIVMSMEVKKERPARLAAKSKKKGNRKR